MSLISEVLLPVTLLGWKEGRSPFTLLEVYNDTITFQWLVLESLQEREGLFVFNLELYYLGLLSLFMNSHFCRSHWKKKIKRLKQTLSHKWRQDPVAVNLLKEVEAGGSPV